MKQSQNYRQKSQNSGHIKNHPISFSTISASIVQFNSSENTYHKTHKSTTMFTIFTTMLQVHMIYRIISTAPNKRVSNHSQVHMIYRIISTASNKRVSNHSQVHMIYRIISTASNKRVSNHSQGSVISGKKERREEKNLGDTDGSLIPVFNVLLLNSQKTHI